MKKIFAITASVLLTLACTKTSETVDSTTTESTSTTTSQSGVPPETNTTTTTDTVTNKGTSSSTGALMKPINDGAVVHDTESKPVTDKENNAVRENAPTTKSK